MSEKLEKLRAMLEKEKERRIKLNNRIEILERRIQEADRHPEPGCAGRGRCCICKGGRYQ